MNRRYFLRLSCGAFVIAFLWKKLSFELSPTVPELHRWPLHECVDRPNLPCPACLKWMGDGFGTEGVLPCSEEEDSGQGQNSRAA